MELAIAPAFGSRGAPPALQLPESRLACIALIQLPAVELVAPERLALAHHQAIAAGGGLAVAQAQASAPCLKRQQARHGVEDAVLVL